MEQLNNTISKKKRQHITEEERYKIEAYLEQGLSANEIAKKIKKSKRTIERERNRGTRSVQMLNPSNKKYEDMFITKNIYQADIAQNDYNEKATNKGRQLKIGNDHKLVRYITHCILVLKLSPDATIGKAKYEKMQFANMICTKTLYNYIDRELFFGISNKDLPEKWKKKKRKYKRVRAVALHNRLGTSIEKRPESINNREDVGHWEIDLVISKRSSKRAILTMVERKSRKSVYELLKNKTQEEVLKGLRRIKRRMNIDEGIQFKTVTADNGSEFLDFEGIKKALSCEEVYYAHPYCSSERGSNENGNRILRRFIPKDKNIGEVTKKRLQEIEDWVNNLPRKILGYRTANEAIKC